MHNLYNVIHSKKLRSDSIRFKASFKDSLKFSSKKKSLCQNYVPLREQD